MGWAFCGQNRHGQETGYGVPATCDEPGCEKEIDHGLGYLCGGNRFLHDTEHTCAKYYCGEHLFFADTVDPDTGERCYVQACSRCVEKLEREANHEDHQTELQDRSDTS